MLSAVPVVSLQNINWVTPLQRSTFTMAALINTGSLWLYEGPNSVSPAPLLVARLINRGIRCDIQTPDVKLTQPASDPAAGLTYCQKLDGGAMRPPGVWDGGVSCFWEGIAWTAGLFKLQRIFAAACSSNLRQQCQQQPCLHVHEPCNL